MLRNWAYYKVKPLLPQAVRMAIRRQFALRRRPQLAGTWPVLPGSQRLPEHWPGWPGDKKFAVVLTHDVETAEGVTKCRQLMQLESSLGFRSSFNFIPEGGYTVPRELREELVAAGFEVGVHDLRHDGKLYKSRRQFTANAKRINGYLRDWGATGFRSGFMLHKLDWLHDLDVTYDSSTFDVDPFEPQPDGAGTIFPFWVPRPDGDLRLDTTDPNSRPQTVKRSGYVEIPYTLPQDSTLFLMLQERSPDIWLRKLDWIAEHGGMALVNVHPDYIAFSGHHSAVTFPHNFYSRLLDQISTKYAGQYWHATAREIANYVSSLTQPPLNPKPKRVAVISHSVYLSDNRVRRYAEALAERGDHVDVFALRPGKRASREDQVSGVRIYRIQDRFAKTERSKFAYLWPLLRFTCAASFRLTRSHFRDPYDLVHVHNIPDFLVFAAWYPKITGVAIILDIHDIVPEFFASKFMAAPEAIPVRLLKLIERWSAGFADRIIIANDLWLERYASRTGASGRCSVLINHVDSKLFTPGVVRPIGGKQILLYPGGLQSHQGLDVAIRAFGKVADEFVGAEFHIYGDGSAKESLVQLTHDLRLSEKVKFFEPKTVREIAEIMRTADVGVVPKRADSFGDEAYSTKVMEFMAVGVPVVISRTKVDQFYFDDSVVRFVDSGDFDAFAREIIGFFRHPETGRSQADRALNYVAVHCWEKRKSQYLRMVDSLSIRPSGRDRQQVA